MKLIVHLAICFILNSAACLRCVKAWRCDVKGLTAATIDTCEEFLLEVQYKNNEPVVGCGSELTVTQAKKAPVSISYEVPESDTDQYLLLMVDPDAPRQDNPIYRTWLHWAVTGISSDGIYSGNLDGKTAMPYAGPTPPPGSGFHRYVFYLFKQPDGPIVGIPEKERGSFDVDQFARQNDLCKGPIATFQFETQPAV